MDSDHRKTSAVLGGVIHRALVTIYVGAYVLTLGVGAMWAWDELSLMETDYSRVTIQCDDGKVREVKKRTLDNVEYEHAVREWCEGRREAGIKVNYTVENVTREVWNVRGALEIAAGWLIATVLAFEVIKRTYQYVAFGRAWL